jgi:hypothetical protein
MVFNLSLNSGDCPCAMNKVYGRNGVPQQLYCYRSIRWRKGGSKTPAGPRPTGAFSGTDDQ